MFPRQHRRLLTIALKEISSAQLIFRCIGQLEICSATSEKQLERIVVVRAIIELREAALAFASIMKNIGFGCIQEPVALECLPVEEVAEFFAMTTIINRYVVAQKRTRANRQAPMIIGIKA